MNILREGLLLGLAALGVGCSSAPSPVQPGASADGRRPTLQACAGPSPDYPSEMAAIGAEGISRVRYHVDKSGTVVRAELLQSSGYAALDDVALSKLKTCRFKPAQDKEGSPIDGSLVVEYKWKLN